MNKYENAIDIVARYCSDVRSGVTPRMVLTNELDILMELVEKATPKQVIKKYTGYIKNSDDIKFDIYFHYCPNCNVVFAGCDLGCTYCQGCGQALDWSAEDE